ncbi:hypothetical protein Clacol_001110 [Clathrus columnatus]|uniref:3-dehydrosphinganine reductase n=1 Tax=Clathrus columnatus TaxID=1419009 RepID=A0AAV4ZXP2_9AGAM|nr:hypothetical protein Clacol_001110 [Clathrus columnatus]
MFGQKKWVPKGQHCYVTGGSQGTGLSLAIILVKQGAHVSIVARDQNKLKKAVEELEKVRQNSDQIIKWYSHSLSTYEGASAALQEACQPFGGKVPNVIFNCAGSSRPTYFVEETPETMKNGMDNAYWVQAYTALVASKMMVGQKSKGKIVFVASTLAYFSMVGYASYAPGKFALRGLAESLRSEFQLYGIGVHIYYPCTIFTPGYAEEMKTKPAITAKIEESDSGITPETAAQGILDCVQKGKFQHASDWITNFFRSATRGSGPGDIFDPLRNIGAWIIIPIVRAYTDRQVRGVRVEHEEYLRSKGFYESNK